MEEQKQMIQGMLKGIDRYNPNNVQPLERYVLTQAKSGAYDLEANLALLKLYQFNPTYYNPLVTSQILLKALTNLPHTDFILCKCLLSQAHLEKPPLDRILYLADLLELCQFKLFWKELTVQADILQRCELHGFEDAIRSFVCHVVGVTYQRIEKHVLVELLGNIDDSVLKHWMAKNGWQLQDGGTMVFVSNQDDSVKTKNITENIDFESVAGILAASR